MCELLVSDWFRGIRRSWLKTKPLCSCPGEGVEAAGLVVPPSSLGNQFLQRSPEPAAIWTQCSVGANRDHRLSYGPSDPPADLWPLPRSRPPQHSPGGGPGPAQVRDVRWRQHRLFQSDWLSVCSVFSRSSNSSERSGSVLGSGETHHTNKNTQLNAAAETHTACGEEEEENTDEWVFRFSFCSSVMWTSLNMEL